MVYAIKLGKKKWKYWTIGCLFSYTHSALYFMLNVVFPSSLAYLENDRFTKLIGSLRTINGLESDHIKGHQLHVTQSELEWPSLLLNTS